MLNQTSEHAIRALLYLAQRPAGEAAPAERIATALGAPANYLAKTLNTLAKQGLLRSTRGPAGGFRLRRAPEQITLAEVVTAFTEHRVHAQCLLGDRPCQSDQPCAAHACWEAISEEMQAPLNRTTIADLLNARAGERTPAGSAGIHGHTANAA